MNTVSLPLRSSRSVRPSHRGGDPFARLLDDVWRGFGVAPTAPAEFVPRLDVQESDAEYVVRAELPGLDEKDVEISLEDNVLTLRGEKRTAGDVSQQGYRLRERREGSFRRRLALPTAVDAEAVTATAKNGVVTITLPKAPEARTRTIPVTTD